MSILIKKIECPNELSFILDFFFEKYKDYLNKLYNSSFDSFLVKNSLCHESLIKGQFSIWVLYKNKELDSIFIGVFSKCEKLNKKIYQEYLFLNNSKKGLLLFKEAINFAKKMKCERLYFKNYNNLLNNSFSKRRLVKAFEIFYLDL